jgi:hypothetical protein
MDRAETDGDEGTQQAASVDNFDEDANSEEGQVPAPRFEFTDSEKKALLSLKELGVEYQGETSSHIKFVRPKDRPRFRSESAIPRADMQVLARQLERNVIEHPTLTGFLVPSYGYAEIVVRDSRWPRSVTSERLLALHFDELHCAHNEPGRQLPSLPFMPRMGLREPVRTSRVHLASSTPGPCVELSNASPLAALLYGWVSSDHPSLLLTIKIDHDRMAIREHELIRRAEGLARSLVYELDVRNGRVIGLSPRPLPSEVRRPTRPEARLESIRYPEIEIQHEVADLFNFASHASDNPPLAFLSYYQTLEYFIPAAVRRSTLDRIRRELRDPMFDRDSDKCIMRIMSTAERSARLPEADQTRILVREKVRHDRLEEFFSSEWGNYFSKHGPVQGVEVINLKHPTKDLTDQVADRIYQIRNRIVHAKDDPRYEEARVLLPRGQEAQALGPDVELVRLLASEAVLTG